MDYYGFLDARLAVNIYLPILRVPPAFYRCPVMAEDPLSINGPAIPGFLTYSEFSAFSLRHILLVVRAANVTSNRVGCLQNFLATHALRSVVTLLGRSMILSLASL
jgi:hypothetical protein